MNETVMGQVIARVDKQGGEIDGVREHVHKLAEKVHHASAAFQVAHQVEKELQDFKRESLAEFAAVRHSMDCDRQSIQAQKKETLGEIDRRFDDLKQHDKRIEEQQERENTALKESLAELSVRVGWQTKVLALLIFADIVNKHDGGAAAWEYIVTLFAR